MSRRTMAVIPSYLKLGDTVGICAPSGSFDQVKFEAGLLRIREMGFKLHLPQGLDAAKHYLAGEDLHRAEIVNDLFRNQEVKAILCARGGFGALRVLPHLDYDLLNASPKFLVGFSDITALLLAGISQSPFLMIHGPVVTSLALAPKRTVDSLFQSLTGPVSEMVLPKGKALRNGRASGTFAGGNLATMVSMAGTRFQPFFNDCILFLEDTGEPAYKIDRMLTQLDLAGSLAGVRGVVLGTFDRCGHKSMIYNIVTERFDDPRVPILAGLDAGHGAINLSLPLGGKVTMDSEKHSLKFHSREEL